MSRLVLVANIYSVAVVPLTFVLHGPNQQHHPLPTNRLISFLVLPNLTSFLYHSSFLELCPNLCCLFSFHFLAHATKIPPLPHVIPIL
ncbi:hypothetical protein EDB84DRAFT_1492828, partial [Lactarius hengduanensis]